jgi:L-threonylcarbamoyladenylate synthase
MKSGFSDDLRQAIEVLRSGGIILYPTDTIWGIGCDATNVQAVKRVYEIKRREDVKSMLVLIENPNQLNSYVVEVPAIAWDLINVVVEPLTIIYPNAKNLAANLIAHDGSIGIRITNEQFTQQLIGRFRKPIVSTSANISSHKTPLNFRDISDEIKNRVDYIVKYRQDDLTKSDPSSILRLGVGGQIEIIRK